MDRSFKSFLQGFLFLAHVAGIASVTDDDNTLASLNRVDSFAVEQINAFFVHSFRSFGVISWAYDCSN